MEDASSDLKRVFIPILKARVSFRGDWNNPEIAQVVSVEDPALNPFTILRVALLEAQRRTLIV